MAKLHKETREFPVYRHTLVGHADVDMTKHYLHVQDPVRLTAIAKFNSAFFGSDDENHPSIIEFYKSS